jgi:hypothetical protein
MDVWFCVTRRNLAERHNCEVMNTLSETTRRSPERYGKALPHLTKTYHGSRLIGNLTSNTIIVVLLSDKSVCRPSTEDIGRFEQFDECIALLATVAASGLSSN